MIINKSRTAAALVSALLLTTTPVFAAGSDRDEYAFVSVGAGRLGDPGNMKCEEMLNNAADEEKSKVLIIWLAGMATGVNFATPGLIHMNPKTKTSDVLTIVLKQCGAEPDFLVAMAAALAFKFVAEKEGRWSDDRSDIPVKGEVR